MSWVEQVWAAQRVGQLSGEEAWQVLLEARDAPNPAGVVAVVLSGLAIVQYPAVHTVKRPMDADMVVIEDA